MADQSDVETAIVTAVATALAGGSVPNRVYRGWPTTAALSEDLAVGIVNVSVFPADNPRDTTRYPATWRVIKTTPPTMSVTVVGATITFTGTPAAGQMAGAAVDGATFVYLVQAGDTTALVAASLAAQLIAGGWIVQIADATVTIPAAFRLAARVEQAQTAYRETRRQMQTFRVSCWCPGPAPRDLVAGMIDSAMADTAFLPLVDGTSARITAAGGATIDQSENATLYRRDLLYAADYPTIVTAALPAMLFGIGTLTSPAGTLAPLLG
jgi:hypothetical protein